MDLGLLFQFHCPQPWAGEHPWGQRTSERRAYRNCIEQSAFADKVGFDSVWCVEHHFRENRSHMPASEVVLGAISQITQKMKLGFGVTLAPHEFIHPARLAEKVATVDLLSQGRVIWGVGRSTPMEQGGFRVDRALSKDKMRAAVKSVVGRWDQEHYEEHSEFLDFPKRMVTPKPYQYPHPPVWMAASSEASAEGAGRDGCGLLCFSILQPLSQIRLMVAAYRSGQQKAKPLTSVHTNKVYLCTLVHCADSRDRFGQDCVWDSLWWWYKGEVEFFLKWEAPDLDEASREAIFPIYEAHARGKFQLQQFDEEDLIIVGTPDECLEKFLRYEEAGVDGILCHSYFGYIPQEAALRSIELLGTYVVPELQKRRANRIAASLIENLTHAKKSMAE